MHGASKAVANDDGVNVGGAIIAGLCANLVGIGLSRFAYTQLIPALVTADWFAPSQAAYLGAANLMGYLAGAVTSRRLTRYAPIAVLLRGMMLVISVTFVGCAYPFPFAVFFVMRFASGFAGGVLMVLGAPAVLEQVPAPRRGLVAGIIIAGVGGGMVASGTLVPFMLRYGLADAWLALAALSLLLTILAWPRWPRERAVPGPQAETPRPRLPQSRKLTTLYLGSTLTAIGLVPHYVFVVDFIARGLGLGIEAGARYWVIAGLGALVGPMVTGHFGDRAGFKAAFRLSYLVQAAMIGAFALASDSALLMIASIVVGAYIPSIVPLALGRIQEILPHDREAQRNAWRVCTTAFAVGQAAGGYGYSFLFAQSGGNYRLLFVTAAITFVVAFAFDLLATDGRREITLDVRP